MPRRLREKDASAVGVKARLIEVHVPQLRRHTRLTAVQGMKQLKAAMFTPFQMQQIDKAAAAISCGDSVMSPHDLQQLYNEVRVFVV